MPSALLGFFEQPSLEWAPSVTMAFLIGFQPWRGFGPPGSGASACGLVCMLLLVVGVLLPGATTHPALWLSLAAAHFGWIYLAYFAADNHHYLQGYWCLTLALALTVGGTDGQRVLELSARTLLGLCFAVAVISKVVSRRYLNGTFFVHSLLFDSRFLPMASYLGGITPEHRHTHREARRRVLEAESQSERLPVSARLLNVARAVTWWLLLVEILLAALYLVPSPGLDLWRTVVLVAFVSTTFAVVPVPTFGHILLIIAMVSTNQSMIRPYLFLLALVLIPIALLLTKLGQRVSARFESAERRFQRDSRAIV